MIEFIFSDCGAFDVSAMKKSLSADVSSSVGGGVAPSLHTFLGPESSLIHFDSSTLRSRAHGMTTMDHSLHCMVQTQKSRSSKKIITGLVNPPGKPSKPVIISRKCFWMEKNLEKLGISKENLEFFFSFLHLLWFLSGFP